MLRFTESIADFGHILQEHGADRVLHTLKEFYPEQAGQLFQAYLDAEVTRRIPALFKTNANPPV